MYTRLYGYLESQKLLYLSQYGFRSKRSCEQAITELVGNILQSKNRNDHCASIFLDLSKAFDHPRSYHLTTKAGKIWH